MTSTENQLFLGVMSGTSLDGLDLALCSFESAENRSTPRIVEASTIVYAIEWKKRLSEAHKLSAEAYFRLHSLYGKYIGHCITDFLKTIPKKPDFIASHGHTIFHQPQHGFTTQMGCGATIAATTGISTICDFRSLDVALNGQGAPLVPIGDELLFPEYEACLNLGGIANISFRQEKTRRAFDICFVNMVLNDIVAPLGLAYDKDGDLARSGTLNESLLQELKNVFPKANNSAFSLGRENYEAYIKPLLSISQLSIPDKLATCIAYANDAMSIILKNNQLKTCFITGGGAHHLFLIEQLRKNNPTTQLIIPDKKTIDFKEALIFAFLGYLRVNKKTNSLKSVTGASRDSIGGAIYLGL
jgi:anhydro-N-acetylmuramic acid kinase